MREVGPELSRSIADMLSLAPEPHSKTPARRGYSPGRQAGVGCEVELRARTEGPSYILDFPLGCRCQGVGNWQQPGGVMLATHPPAKLTTSGIWHCVAGGARGKRNGMATTCCAEKDKEIQ